MVCTIQWYYIYTLNIIEVIDLESLLLLTDMGIVMLMTNVLDKKTHTLKREK